MAIRLYYDSISQAAEDFGCSRQWLGKLIERGDLVSYPIPNEQQRRRVWHQHVAEALANNGGLRPHSCVCYDTAHLQGIEEGRQESAPQLAQVQQELAEAREELAQVKAQLVEVETALSEASEDVGPNRETIIAELLQPFNKDGWAVHAEINTRIHRNPDRDYRHSDPELAPYQQWYQEWFDSLPGAERGRLRFGDRKPAIAG